MTYAGIKFSDAEQAALWRESSSIVFYGMPTHVQDDFARRLGMRPLKPPPYSGAGPSETAAARAARRDRKNGTIPELTFRLRTRFGGT